MNKLGEKYDIRALASTRDPNSYVAEFEVPGRAVHTLLDEDGQNPELFEFEADAVAAAGEELCDFMNSRVRAKVRNGYVKMSGADFALAMARLNLEPKDFGKLYGTDIKRVMSWIEGTDHVPNPARLLLTYFAMPGMLEMAYTLTSGIVYDKRDKKELASE